MIDTSTPNSPGWWFARLATQLADRRPHYDGLQSYYRGTNSVPTTAIKTIRESYQRLMELARTNYAHLVVGAVLDRMKPVAFRTGADGDETGDKEAWRIWQANSLDADFKNVLRDSLVMGTGYMMVGGPDPEIGAPLITPESPLEVIAELDPRRRRKVRAAIKVFTDDVEGCDRAYVYLPGFVFYASRKSTPGNTETLDLSGWDWDETAYATLPVPVVPVVPFPNTPPTGGCGVGEYEPHLSLLDRITKGTLDQLEIATLQAFKQRAIKGVPNKDAQGNEIDYDDVWSSDPGAMWVLPDTAEVWESGTVDLNPLRMARRDDVQDLAAVTRTPLFYLTPEAANGSAEGASLAREGLVFKTEDHIADASEGGEQVMSIAFAFAGDTARANRRDMEVLWASPERFSLAERYDAAVKAQAAGVPWRTVMADVLQFSPQKIDRMDAERFTDALLAPPPVQTPVAPAEPAPVAP